MGRRHCTQCEQWEAPKASSAIAICVTVTVGGHRQPKNHQMRWVKGYYTVPSHTVWNVRRVNGSMVDWEGPQVTPPAGIDTAMQSSYGNIYVRIHRRIRSRASDITKDVRLASLSIGR